MAEWLAGIEIADLVRVDIVRVTLEGTPSAVTTAVLRLHLAGGRSVLATRVFSYGVVYETFAGDIAALNALLRRRRG